MKKILALLALLALVPAVGYAANYPYLVFTTSSGEQEAIAAESLTINYLEGKIIAVNGSTTLTFEAADLLGMEFSESTTTKVQTLETDGKLSITAYTLDGKYAGMFSSVENARNSLDNGIYVLHNENGDSIKIKIIK